MTEKVKGFLPSIVQFLVALFLIYLGTFAPVDWIRSFAEEPFRFIDQLQTKYSIFLVSGFLLSLISSWEFYRVFRHKKGDTNTMGKSEFALEASYRALVVYIASAAITTWFFNFFPSFQKTVQIGSIAVCRSSIYVIPISLIYASIKFVKYYKTACRIKVP